MPGVLDYTIDSVVYNGLYITVNSLYAGYSQSDDIDVVIMVDGQWTGILKAGNFGPTVPIGSVFYSWMDLIGQDPHTDPVPPVPGHSTTITIFDKSIGSDTGPNSAGITDFPWPGSGGTACFTASSKLLTPAGYVTASALHTGDLLVTADGRQVPIKAHTFIVKADKSSAPYLIPKNSLARNVPVADLHLSPWHAISLGKGLWQKPQSAAELNPGSVTQYDIGKNVQYYHFEAPNYFTDNFICEGTVVESFGAKQVSEKERPYTWSAKYKAYTRSAKNKTSNKSIGM